MSRTGAGFAAGKVAVVTGGAQGLGWALAQALADHGATVAICDIAEDRLEEARGRLAGLPFGDRIRLSHCDVSLPEEFRAWLARVRDEIGPIGILVNNAAFVRWQDAAEMAVEDALKSMRVTYDAMVVGVNAVLPGMLDAGGGHVVNIGSSAGRIFLGGASAAYAAAKAAVDGYTQILQIELRNRPVTVTLVRPAAVAGTDFFRRHVPHSRMPRMGDFIPFSSPPEVAEAVIAGMERKRRVVNVPRYLPLFSLAFELAPGLLRWIAAQGGSGRREYGKIEWRYRPRNERS